MFCSHCGKQVPADTKFCPYCGADLRGATSAKTEPQPTTRNEQSAPRQSNARGQRVKNWYRGLRRPWLVWLLVVLIIVGVGGGIYHYHSFRLEVARENPWVIVTSDELNGKSPVMKLSFNKSGRLAVNRDSDAETFASSLNDSLQDAGSWHGDHKKVMFKLTGHNLSGKATMTKLKKTSKTINGYTYKGFFVQFDSSDAGSKVSQNVYLLHR